jgi:hypothetical protein
MTKAPWTAKRDECHFGSLSEIVGGNVRQGIPVHQVMIEVGGYAQLSEQEANTVGLAKLRNLIPDIIKSLESQWIKITDDPDSLPQLPEHECGLFLSHNEHRNYYEPIAQFIEDGEFKFESEEAKARAIATDELWVLQWYPDTPVGFLRVAAPTLADVLRLALPAPPEEHQ